MRLESLQFIRSQSLGAQQLPAILTGPVVTDTFGIPRYGATIGLDPIDVHVGKLSSPGAARLASISTT